MNYDEIIDLKSLHSTKWTCYQETFGIEGDDILPMWVADMDFVAPEFLKDCVRDIADGGFFGYFHRLPGFFAAVQWWLDTRHGWKPDTEWMTVTAGLGNGIATAINALSEPDDGVVIFTPVYHEFAKKIRKSNRRVLECPLAVRDGTFHMDFDTYDTLMSGDERLAILSSPHNPGGRVWTGEELRELAEFCIRHDLILIADEIHADLTFPGQKFVTAPVAMPDFMDRVVMMTSASKAFNIAGTRTGCVTIPNEDLRNRFRTNLATTDLSPNLFGVAMSQAAFSPDGLQWIDEVTRYIQENAKLFQHEISALPGISVMPMQSTYLAWVDFTDTGMTSAEVWKRVTEVARIMPSPGPDFGPGGELGLRFNLGTPRSNVVNAIKRMQAAFADLQ